MARQSAEQLLNEFRAKDAAFSHTRIPGPERSGVPGGKFNVPLADLPRLHAALFAEFAGGGARTVTNLNARDSPAAIKARVDLDLKFVDVSGVPKQRVLSDRGANWVKGWVEILASVVELPDRFEVIEQLKATPSEKKGGGYSYGLHFILPEVVVTSDVLMYCRTSALPRMAESWGDLVLAEPSWEKVFDADVYKSCNWMVYGHCKPESKPYQAVRNLTFDRTGRLVADEPVAVGWDCEYENWIRMCVWANPEAHVLPMTPFGASVVRPAAPRAAGLTFSAGAAAKGAEEMAEIYAHVLNIPAGQPYDVWRDVGQALKNIDDSEATYTVWSEWSATTPDKHDEANCARVWRAFIIRDSGPRVGPGTIFRLSKTLNPEGYAKLRSESLEGQMLEAVKSKPIPEGMIADIIKRLYGDRFRCSKKTGGTWYEFVGHRWTRDEDGASFQRDIIQKEMPALFGRKATEFAAKRDREEVDSDAYKALDHIRSRLEACRMQLKCHTFSTHVMSQCCLQFYQADFEERLDINPDLLGLANGVLDMTDKTNPHIRDGRPEDMISKSTGHIVDLSTEITADPLWPDLARFLDNLYATEAVKEYSLRRMSLSLNGFNDGKITVHTGDGANGKTVLQNIVLSAFGNAEDSSVNGYAVKLHSSIVTEKRGHSGSAEPQYLILKGVRHGYVEEPEKDRLNTNVLKELTGRKSARPLFSNKFISFTVQAKLALLCNQKPAIDTDDTGFIRRLDVLHYCWKFVHRPTLAHHKMRDDSLARRAESGEFGALFLKLLIAMYIENGGYADHSLLEEPKEVKEYSLQYVQENNSAARFTKDCVVFDKDIATKTTKTTIAQFLRRWRAEHHEVERLDIDRVMIHLGKELGDYPVGGWRGIRMKEEEDD